MKAVLVLSIATLALASSAVAGERPDPGTLKTFQDWVAGCDNGLACRAVALVPEAEDGDNYLMLTVDRGPGGRALLSVPVPAAGRYRLAIDGRATAVLTATKGGATIPLDRPLAAALADGAQAVLVDEKGARKSAASLKGLAAALLYIDHRQGLVGTSAALRRPGTRSPGIRSVPALPVIVSPAPGVARPRLLSVAAATRLLDRDDVQCDNPPFPVAARTYRLDPAHSLAVIDHPCGNGASNMFSSVFVVDQAGKVAPARFDRDPGMGDGDTIDNVAVNGDWDPKTRRFATFAKGRGLGDCGVSQVFAWDGRLFRLVEESDMNECRGARDFITTWHARVMQR